MSGPEIRIGIICGEWYPEIVTKMKDSAVSTLRTAGLADQGIEHHSAPGAYEMPLLAHHLAGRKKNPLHALVALGVVIRGETPHFDYVCQACSQGIMTVMLASAKPIGFGVLTVDTANQARARAEKKASEAARAALAMLGRVSALQG